MPIDAETPDVKVTMCLGPMPPDASDFPGGIPALQSFLVRSHLRSHRYIVYAVHYFTVETCLIQCGALVEEVWEEVCL